MCQPLQVAFMTGWWSYCHTSHISFAPNHANEAQTLDVVVRVGASNYRAEQRSHAPLLTGTGLGVP
jgi:hypothetical protein